MSDRLLLAKLAIDTENKRTYTVMEIAKILGICKTFAYELTKEGHFHSVKSAQLSEFQKHLLTHGLMEPINKENCYYGKYYQTQEIIFGRLQL